MLGYKLGYNIIMNSVSSFIAHALFALMEIICMQALQDKTGVTWNKRFKKQFGPITKVRSLLQGSYSITVNLTYSSIHYCAFTCQICVIFNYYKCDIKVAIL